MWPAHTIKEKREKTHKITHRSPARFYLVVSTSNLHGPMSCARLTTCWWNKKTVLKTIHGRRLRWWCFWFCVLGCVVQCSLLAGTYHGTKQTRNQLCCAPYYRFSESSLLCSILPDSLAEAQLCIPKKVRHKQIRHAPVWNKVVSCSYPLFALALVVRCTSKNWQSKRVMKRHSLINTHKSS